MAKASLLDWEGILTRGDRVNFDNIFPISKSAAWGVGQGRLVKWDGDVWREEPVFDKAPCDKAACDEAACEEAPCSATLPAASSKDATASGCTAATSDE